MSWCVFPDGWTGRSSLPDPVLESSSLDPLWSILVRVSSVSGLPHQVRSFYYWQSVGLSFLASSS